MLTVLPVMALPGIMGMYFGYRLLREKTARSYMGVIAVFAVLADGYLSYLLVTYSPLQLHERIENSIYSVIATLLIIPLYAHLTAFLMRRGGLQVNDPWSLVGRWAVLIAAVEIFSCTSRLFDLYAPVRDGMRHLHPPGWEFLAFAVPIGSAAAFYKLSLRFLHAHRSHPPAPQEISTAV